MIITTTFDITPRRIADLMVTAIEGNHMTRAWCEGIYLEVPDIETLKDRDSIWYDCEDLYANPVLQIRVEVDDGEDERKDTKYIGLVEMERAFVLMQTFGNGTSNGYCWKDFLNENEDAITADVWLQLCVFGEVLYG